MLNLCMVYIKCVWIFELSIILAWNDNSYVITVT